MSDNQIRAVTLIEEEIAHLSRVLDGMPPPLRGTGAFDSYEMRLLTLKRELSLARLESVLEPLGLSSERYTETFDAVRRILDSVSPANGPSLTVSH